MDLLDSLSKVVAVAGLSLLYVFQTHLIYPSNVPEGSRQVVFKPDQFGLLNYEEVYFTSSDNIKLHAYLIKTVHSATHTIFYFHANAGNMGHRLPIAKLLMKFLGCNIFIFSYRGYGLSEGSANEKGLKLDAVAALEFFKQSSLKNTKLVAFGQSIGGAVAIDLVSKYESLFDGMIIENTFLSLHKLIPSVMPYVGHLAPLICHQKWESFKSIGEIGKTPILFLSGSQDELIPQLHMTALFDIVVKKRHLKSYFVNGSLIDSDSGNCWLREFKNGTHNDTCIQPLFFETIKEFWDKNIKV